ncbi:RNA 2',3'-cyclic phosphodiesterase [Candidatus Wolfebacteria bacterium]|nr:RNA 2',3'-cyclic phosphodiesterase [Candidatus Wolfebacteria bacterium]
MKRLFIAINLPKEIKWQIDAILGEFKGLKFIPSENWHLTIIFLGNQSEEKIKDIVASIKQSTEEFEINFDKIILAPPDTIEKKMIWFTASQKTNDLISKIKNNLDNQLNKNGLKFKNDFKKFNGHITLSRFDNINNLPKDFVKKLPIKLPISFAVESIDLMESHLKPTGAEYECLFSAKFAK